MVKIKSILKDDAIIYIEVPHTSGALRRNDGSLVSIHYNLYSMISLKLIALKLDFEILEIKKITEPSKKKTIYTFMKIKKNVR